MLRRILLGLGGPLILGILGMPFFEPTISMRVPQATAQGLIDDRLPLEAAPFGTRIVVTRHEIDFRESDKIALPTG